MIIVSRRRPVPVCRANSLAFLVVLACRAVLVTRRPGAPGGH
ncbi:putative lipoprotein [Streptomyces ipomoeae 91-03]|uniref:Putative lipoprotein n=1 Tax=Streptomyces ipomoeae 91-03 TaxID=698759 RepID=L1L121_9ACTN|nr:putative lipoprotein [Streptomyces ipomoeae 91-03]